MPPPYTDAQLQAAVEALTDAERFREAESVVAAAAPGLQRVLAEALASGGWFEDSHGQAIADAVARESVEERDAAMRTLLAEESRLAMMIGVAVGWALAGELAAGVPTDPDNPPNEENPQP